MSAVRIDKWLWAARFFKTRALACRACDLGRVESQGQRVKPSREVRIGDLLTIRNETAAYTVEVKGVSDMRGPAPVAQTLYLETEQSRAERDKAREARKALPVLEALTEGRPSKRDRRNLNRLRGFRP